jgi:hypothetical protein
MRQFWLGRAGQQVSIVVLPLRTDDLQRVGRTRTCLRSRCYLISGELGARAARFFCDFWGKVANGWLLLLCRGVIAR